MRTRDKLAIGGKIVAAKLTGRPRPFFVQYSLLNSCNARCVYCNLPSLPDPAVSTKAKSKSCWGWFGYNGDRTALGNNGRTRPFLPIGRFRENFSFNWFEGGDRVAQVAMI